MKKFIVLIAIAVLAVCSVAAFAGCGAQADYNVGIMQWVSHPALDQSAKGFKERLETLIFEQGKTVKFNTKNAAGDGGNASSASGVLVAKNVDMIFAIATPAVQAVSAATSDIPIVFTAVTSAKSAGLDKATNVTGATDLNDVEKQVELMYKLKPDAKKFGILYTTSEDNSTLQKDMAIAAMKARGMSDANIVTKGISESSNIESAFVYFKKENVDCIYIPTDNMLADNADTVHAVNKNTGANIPIVCGETGMSEKCGVATYGVDYYNLGVQAAEMAFEILVNGKKPSEIAVKDPVVTDADFSYNEKVAQAIGFTIPDEVKNIGKNA